MTKGILGRKIGMTQLFSDEGELTPVTVIQAEPNVVLQKRTVENDGYEAAQLGFAEKKESRATKAEKGHAEKANTTPKRYVREIRNADSDAYEVGQEITVNTFQTGDLIDVTGTTKGKGFQGTIKRFNYNRGPKTHGSHFHRSSGSMGDMTAMHVFKGTKLPGQMGGRKATVQNLEVVRVDSERNLILIKGNIPGPKKSFVKVTGAVKANS
ncbi:50S ribosomal protein L3 [Barrientosiimonas marina]|uniref:Large ribosomal subunit protein uL3 n=1 Tax=Lentibacillus kimchii TaxID=1542911 RepID=A0ABW2UX43_9BACI